MGLLFRPAPKGIDQLLRRNRLWPGRIAQDGEQEGYIVVTKIDGSRRIVVFLSGHSFSNG
jgi:hypothetical protein